MLLNICILIYKPLLVVSFPNRTMNLQAEVKYFRSLFKGKSKIHNIKLKLAQFDSRYSQIMFEQHLRNLLFRDKNQHINFCNLWYQIKMFITKMSWDEPKLLRICKIFKHYEKVKISETTQLEKIRKETFNNLKETF